MKAGLRKLLLVIVALFLFNGLAAPSYADDLQNMLSSDEQKRFDKFTDEQKEELRNQIVDASAKERCGEFFFNTNMELTLLPDGKSCEDITREALRDMYPTATEIFTGQPTKGFCDALENVGGPWGAVSRCRSDERMARNKINNHKEIRDFLGQTDLGKSILNTFDAINNTIKFVGDPKSQLDEIANSTKSESVAMTTKVLEQLTSTTDFDPSTPEYKAQWAVYAGLGVVGVGLILMWLFNQHGNGDISDDDMNKSILYYLPAALFLVIYTPWFMGWILNQVDPLLDGTTAWAAEAISNFITVVAKFGAMEATSWFGPIAAIIFFGLLFFGAIALLIFFLLVPIFQQLMGFAIAMLIGMLISPKTRRYVVKVASVFLSMVLLKPLAFLVMGGVFWVLANQPAFKDGTEDALVNVGNLGATAMIMLILVISPAAMFRWMPVVESRGAKFGGISPEVSAGMGAAAGAMVGSGAGAVRNAISKRRNAASSGSSNSSDSGSSGMRSTSDGATGGASSAASQRESSSESSASNPVNPGNDSSTSNATSEARSEDSLASENDAPSSRARTLSSAESGMLSSSSSDRAEPAGNTSDRTSGSEQELSPGSHSNHDDSASQSRDSASGSKLKKAASLTGFVATTPITAGTVGLLAGAQQLSSNAAIQARLAADNADPDDWDSFKDR